MRKIASLVARHHRPVAGLMMLAAGTAKGVTLPEDEAEAMVHVYSGGGVTASGPALLVRKSIADKVSLSGSYYVDSVSNASIDVVTTASKFKETRNQTNLGLDYVYRDALVTLATSHSKEPDYTADSVNLDVAQDVYGGMTTVALGFSRGSDKVYKHGDPLFSDSAKHWQYRLGVTQILTTRWVASANVEAISDDGYLGSPYRAARVFGAAVPERNPRTRSSRSLKLRAIGDIGTDGGSDGLAPMRSSVRAEYRYFWDNWEIKAHTLEVGYARYFQDKWLADAWVRYYKQSKALFYSDNAAQETLYVSRNRQLSSFNDIGLGAKLTYSVGKVYKNQFDVKAIGSVERIRFKYDDFTDLRTGSLYTFNANLFQLVVTATF